MKDDRDEMRALYETHGNFPDFPVVSEEQIEEYELKFTNACAIDLVRSIHMWIRETGNTIMVCAATDQEIEGNVIFREVPLLEVIEDLVRDIEDGEEISEEGRAQLRKAAEMLLGALA